MRRHFSGDANYLDLVAYPGERRFAYCHYVRQHPVFEKGELGMSPVLDC